jgi:broad specificity phosphatase PhoE
MMQLQNTTLPEANTPEAHAAAAQATVVYLARHGTPDWNMRDIRYDIPPGPPLVPQGEQEAAQLGTFLRQAGVRKMYASPLVRAQRTAEIAAAVVGTSLDVADSVAEYRREENDDAVYDRFRVFFDQVWTEAANHGPIAIVSHGGPVRVMLEKLGIPTEHIWHYRRQFDHQNPLPPAGAWAITHSVATGSWQARLVFSPQAYTEYLPAIVYV